MNNYANAMKKSIQLITLIGIQILIGAFTLHTWAFNENVHSGVESSGFTWATGDGIFLLGGFSILTALLILMAYRSRKPMEVRLMRVVANILILISPPNVAQGATF